METEKIVTRVNIAASLTPEKYDEFVEVAWRRRHRTNADAVREAVDEWLNRPDTIDS